MHITVPGVGLCSLAERDTLGSNVEVCCFLYLLTSSIISTVYLPRIGHNACLCNYPRAHTHTLMFSYLDCPVLTKLYCDIRRLHLVDSTGVPQTVLFLLNSVSVATMPTSGTLATREAVNGVYTMRFDCNVLPVHHIRLPWTKLLCAS